MTTLIAFVLPADHSGEPVNFPGFPGIWTPGEPKAAAELVAAGAFATVDDVIARVAELGLPLDQVTVETVDPPAAAPKRPAATTPRATVEPTNVEPPAAPVEGTTDKTQEV